MRVCRGRKTVFQPPWRPSGSGLLLVVLLVCGGGFGYTQEPPARPAAPGLRRVDPVELQGRPEFQALLAGAAAYLVLWALGMTVGFTMWVLTLILIILSMVTITASMLLLLISTIPKLIEEIHSFPKRILTKYSKKVRK